jgi:hypothetical protein
VYPCNRPWRCIALWDVEDLIIPSRYTDSVTAALRTLLNWFKNILFHFLLQITWRYLKFVMLATAKDNMAGIKSFARLTEAVAVVMQQWSATWCVYCWNVVIHIFFQQTECSLLGRGKSTASPSVALRCAVANFGVIGSHFFEDRRAFAVKTAGFVGL